MNPRGRWYKWFTGRDGVSAKLREDEGIDEVDCKQRAGAPHYEHTKTCDQQLQRNFYYSHDKLQQARTWLVFNGTNRLYRAIGE